MAHTPALFTDGHHPTTAEIEAITDLLINQVASYNVPLHEDLLDPRENLALHAKQTLQQVLGAVTWLNSVSGGPRFSRSSAFKALAELSALATRRFSSLELVNP